MKKCNKKNEKYQLIIHKKNLCHRSKLVCDSRNRDCAIRGGPHPPNSNDHNDNGNENVATPSQCSFNASNGCELIITENGEYYLRRPSRIHNNYCNKRTINRVVELNKSKRFICGIIKFLTSTPGLILLIVIYSVMGAIIFPLIEAPIDINKSVLVEQGREECLKELWKITEKLNVLYECNWTMLVEEQLRRFEGTLVTAVMRNNVIQSALGTGTTNNAERNLIVNRNDIFNDASALTATTNARSHLTPSTTWDNIDYSMHWTFSNALLYSITVITTIGQGSLTPRTACGKIATILYALIGVPLMLMCLSNLGALLANALKYTYIRLLCHKAHNYDVASNRNNGHKLSGIDSAFTQIGPTATMMMERKHYLNCMGPAIPATLNYRRQKQQQPDKEQQVELELCTCSHYAYRNGPCKDSTLRESEAIHSKGYNDGREHYGRDSYEPFSSHDCCKLWPKAKRPYEQQQQYLPRTVFLELNAPIDESVAYLQQQATINSRTSRTGIEGEEEEEEEEGTQHQTEQPLQTFVNAINLSCPSEGQRHNRDQQFHRVRRVKALNRISDHQSYKNLKGHSDSQNQNLLGTAKGARALHNAEPAVIIDPSKQSIEQISIVADEMPKQATGVALATRLLSDDRSQDDVIESGEQEIGELMTTTIAKRSESVTQSDGHRSICVRTQPTGRPETTTTRTCNISHSDSINGIHENNETGQLHGNPAPSTTIQSPMKAVNCTRRPFTMVTFVNAAADIDDTEGPAHYGDCPYGTPSRMPLLPASTIELNATAQDNDQDKSQGMNAIMPDANRRRSGLTIFHRLNNNHGQQHQQQQQRQRQRQWQSLTENKGQQQESFSPSMKSYLINQKDADNHQIESVSLSPRRQSIPLLIPLPVTMPTMPMPVTSNLRSYDNSKFLPDNHNHNNDNHNNDNDHNDDDDMILCITPEILNSDYHSNEPLQEPNTRPNPLLDDDDDDDDDNSLGSLHGDYHPILDDDGQQVPIILIVLILIFYISIGTVIFSLWENLSIIDGVYFCFVTLTTIGYGDYLPLNTFHGAQMKLIAFSIYLLIGLILVAMSFNILETQLIWKCKRLAVRLKLSRD